MRLMEESRTLCASATESEPPAVAYALGHHLPQTEQSGRGRPALLEARPCHVPTAYAPRCAVTM